MSRLVNPPGGLCRGRKLIAAMLDVVTRLAIKQTHSETSDDSHSRLLIYTYT